METGVRRRGRAVRLPVCVSLLLPSCGQDSLLCAAPGVPGCTKDDWEEI